jgi:hypothetical protein
VKNFYFFKQTARKIRGMTWKKLGMTAWGDNLGINSFSVATTWMLN